MNANTEITTAIDKTMKRNTLTTENVPFDIDDLLALLLIDQKSETERINVDRSVNSLRTIVMRRSRLDEAFDFASFAREVTSDPNPMGTFTLWKQRRIVEFNLGYARRTTVRFQKRHAHAARRIDRCRFTQGSSIDSPQDHPNGRTWR